MENFSFLFAREKFVDFVDSLSAVPGELLQNVTAGCRQ